MHRRIAWPKLAGGILALESAGLILWQCREWWYHLQYRSHVTAPEWFVLAFTIGLCVLSCGVYCAHEWARRAVIIVGLVAVAAMLLNILQMAFHGIGRVPEFAQEATSEVIGLQIGFVIGGVGVTLCFAAPLALLLAVLAHPDVARSFHGRTTKAI